LLPELFLPRAELAQRVARYHDLHVERERRFTALERFWLDADFDIDAAARSRGTAIISASIVVPVLALIMLRVLGLHQAGYLDALVVTAAPSLAATWNAVSMRTNDASSRTRYVTSVVTAVTAMHFALSWALDIPLDAAMATAMLISAGVAATHAVLMTWQLMWSVLPLVVGALGIALWPGARGLFAIVGWGGAMAVIALVWRRRRRMLRLLKDGAPQGT
jgi:hypothetical protein